MKVLIIRCDYHASQKQMHPRHLHPPLDIIYVLNANLDHEIDFHDEWTDGILGKNTNKDYDLVIIKGSSYCLEEVFKTASHFKDKETPCWVMGQVTSHYKKTEDKKKWHDNFSKIFLGEFETALEEELRGPSLENIITKATLPQNLATPTLTKEQMKKYRFPFPIRGHSIKYWGYVMSAWGCPYMNLCTFCSPIVRKSDGQALRKRGTQLVVEDIKAQIANGAQAICFEDDTLITNKKYANEFLDRMIEEEIKIPWMASLRVNELDEEIIKKMAKTGAKLLKLGIETGSPRIIEKLGKSRSGDKYLNHLIDIKKVLDKYDIGIIGLFMVGNPDENLADIEMTKSIIKQIKPDYIQIQILTPYPDSPLYEKYKDKMPVDSNLYHYKSNDFKLSQIEHHDLLNVQKDIYKKYYLAPAYIINHFFRHIRHYLTPSTMLYSIKLNSRIIKNYLLPNSK